MKKILLLLLTLLAAVTTWASTFTIENDGNNFNITRNGSGTETVRYRTVSLSAMAGENFTENIGWLTFSGNQTKTITVKEANIDSFVDYGLGIYNLLYVVQTSLARTYRFELLTEDGNLITYKDRDLEYGEYYQLPPYVNKNITDLVYFDDAGNMMSGAGNKYRDCDPLQNVGSNWTKVTDAGYSQGVYILKTDVFNRSAYLRIYTDNLGMKMHATIHFKQKEENDGYQYIQILDNNHQTYDGNDPSGAVNAPVISQYKACFELSKSGVTTDEHYQFFPHRYDFVNKEAEQNAGLSHYSFDYDNSYLYEQKYVSNSVHTGSSGSLIFPTTNYYICVRFDAAGNSDDNWYFSNLKARVALVDQIAPTLVDNYKVSGGRHGVGNTIYVSVPFNEIVEASSSTTLNTTWGTLSYVAGNGSNVLTFAGAISASASGTFTVNSYSGSITDMAGNNYTGTISHAFGTQLDIRTYSISYNLAGGSMPSGQSNPTSYTDTTTFTLTNPVRLGYVFQGWTGSNGTTPQTTVTVPKGTMGNLSYTANWSPEIFNISYDLAGGMMPAGQSNPTTYTIETPNFTLINPIREGYDFLGWTDGFSSIPDAHVTIYQGYWGDRSYTAHWRLSRYTFNSETGELALIWGDFNADNKWGDDVPASAVKSVTATSEVNFTGDCSNMFYDFKNCESMDLSAVNTVSVTNMGAMFSGCQSLTSLNLSGWNTGNVTKMYSMFQNCSYLTTISDISEWDTGKVNDMSFMFQCCYSLPSLDLSGWNMSNVDDVHNMFYDCVNLTSLDLSSWDTSNVVYMDRMFYECIYLDSLNISSWDTGNVTDVSEMFYYCYSLTSLDLSGWNTSEITDMEKMFNNCPELTTIYAGPDWSTEKVIYSESMFGGCTKLVGGMGTAYDENHIDAEYARIDRGSNSPGYLTGDVTAVPGDVDGDGVVTSSDVTALYNFILNNDASSIVNGDQDGDGVITAGDVTVVYSILL